MSAAAINVPQTKYKAVMVASNNWPYITKLTVCAAATKAVHTENTNKMNLSIESSSVDRGLSRCDARCDACVTHV